MTKYIFKRALPMICAALISVPGLVQAAEPNGFSWKSSPPLISPARDGAITH